MPRGRAWVREILKSVKPRAMKARDLVMAGFWEHPQRARLEALGQPPFIAREPEE